MLRKRGSDELDTGPGNLLYSVFNVFYSCGISRLTFQMDGASLSHAKLMQAITLIGTQVLPAIKKEA